MTTHREQHISTTPYNTLSKLLGILLTVAGSLKAHALVFDPLSQDGIIYAPWLHILAIEFEIVLGILLLGGFKSKLLWSISLLTFSWFSAVSLYLALTGQASCGCFGQVRVSPWLSLGIDLVVVAALLVLRPAGTSGILVWRNLLPPKLSVKSAVQLVCIVALLLAGVFVSIYLWSDNPKQVLAELRHETFRIEPSVVDVGKEVEGASLMMAVKLRNDSTENIRVNGGAVSCVCMSFHDLPIVVPPGDVATIHISIVFKGSPGRFTHGFKLFHSGKENVTAGRFTGVVAAR